MDMPTIQKQTTLTGPIDAAVTQDPYYCSMDEIFARCGPRWETEQRRSCTVTTVDMQNEEQRVVSTVQSPDGGQDGPLTHHRRNRSGTP
jgi:hypothetical protein